MFRPWRRTGPGVCRRTALGRSSVCVNPHPEAGCPGELVRDRHRRAQPSARSTCPTALAVDAAGNLYVADVMTHDDRIQKRDAQGNWSVIATAGTAPARSPSRALAVDAAGNLYVAELD